MFKRRSGPSNSQRIMSFRRGPVVITKQERKAVATFLRMLTCEKYQIAHRGEDGFGFLELDQCKNST